MCMSFAPLLQSLQLGQVHWAHLQATVKVATIVTTASWTLRANIDATPSLPWCSPCKCWMFNGTEKHRICIALDFFSLPKLWFTKTGGMKTCQFCQEQEMEGNFDWKFNVWNRSFCYNKIHPAMGNVRQILERTQIVYPV